MEYDKINGEVAFRESDHKYFNVKHPDRQYTSVTTLIGKYHEKFDGEFWSRYKALEKLVGPDNFNGNKEEDIPMSEAKRGLLSTKKYDHKWTELYDIDPEDLEKEAEAIRASYQKANEDACERGTMYHNMKENKFYETDVHQVDDLIKVEGEFTCRKGDFDLSRDKAILPEYLVYFSCKDNILNLAGQMDLLIKDGNDIYILDYKTNAKGITTKAYFNTKTKKHKSMFFPIHNVHDTTYEHYTLQLSIYAWMLQKINPDLNIKMLKLLHIDGEGNTSEFELEYRKADVERLLVHYKRQIIIDREREKNKSVL